MEDYEEIAYVQFIEGNNTQKVYRFALYDQAISAGGFCSGQIGRTV